MPSHEADRLVRKILSRSLAVRGELGNRQVARDNKSPDLIFRHRQGRLLVHVKNVRTSLIEDVLARLALSVLERGHRTEEEATLLHVVVVPRLGEKTKKAVREFMSLHSPQSAWGLVDHSGSVSIS